MNLRRSVTLLLAFSLAGILLAGCDQEPAPTGTTEEVQANAAGGPPDQADPEARINNLIKDLFPQPERSQAHQLFDDTKTELSEGDTESAQESALELLELALELFENGELEDPGGQQTTGEALGELVDTLLTFVGFDAAGATDVFTGQKDGVVAVASPDQDNTITTEQEFAGTVIEAEDIDEEILVVIERVLQSEQDALPQGDCLPTGEDQADGCYRFDKSSTDPFLNEVVVGVCPEAFIRNQQGDYEQYQLGKFDPANPGDGVVALPSRDAPFLDCSGFTVASAADDGLWPVVDAGWDATGGRVLSWLGPDPLWAVDAGFGGATINWSRIGWFRPLDAQVFAGDGQTEFAGFPVDQDPTVEVSPAHTGSGVVQGADVTFSVGQGGGTVAGGQTSATVPTDSDGLASVPWALGSAGTNTLQAVAGGDTAIFTASATQAQLPIQCQVGGGGDRVRNLASNTTLGRAFYVPEYPGTDLSQVDLWFASDSADTYDVLLTVRQGSFGGTLLDTTTVSVTVNTNPSTFTQASFTMNVTGIPTGSTLTFEPVVVAGPAEAFFFEVPNTDSDPQFSLPGNSSCPVIETNDASDPFDDRRQGVRVNIEN